MADRIKWYLPNSMNMLVKQIGNPPGVNFLDGAGGCGHDGGWTEISTYYAEQPNETEFDGQTIRLSWSYPMVHRLKCDVCGKVKGVLDHEARWTGEIAT